MSPGDAASVTDTLAFSRLSGDNATFKCTSRVPIAPLTFSTHGLRERTAMLKPHRFFLALAAFASTIEKLQRSISRILRWLALLMTATVCAIVVLRLFTISSTALQESVSYLHSSLFMLCIAYAAQVQEHVRVDIFYRRFNTEQRAWLNLLGGILLLLPFALFLTLVSWEFALTSWRIRESSNNPGGLPLVYVLKSLVPLGGLLLSLHALADIARQLIAISTREHGPGASPESAA